MKRIIIAQKDGIALMATSLTKLCDKNKEVFKYNYLKSKKYPFSYKGWSFKKEHI